MQVFGCKLRRASPVSSEGGTDYELIEVGVGQGKAPGEGLGGEVAGRRGGG